MRPFVHKFFGRKLRIFPRPKPPAPIPTVPPKVDLGVFSGVGAFTYGSPEVVLPYVDLLDWVAVLPTSDWNLARDISRHTNLHIWDTGQDTQHGIDAVEQLAFVDGYIGQAESPEQYVTTCEVLAYLSVPGAIITNVTSLPYLNPGTVTLTEAYENANPNATVLNLDYEARKRGATKVAPTFGMYHEGDEGQPGYVAKLPLQHYLDEFETAMIGQLFEPDFSFWIAEQLDAEDWAALAKWREKHPK